MIFFLKETILLKNQCVTEENSFRIQNEEEVKVLTETLKKSKKQFDSLSSKRIEKEEKLSKFNVRNFNKRMERKKT